MNEKLQEIKYDLARNGKQTKEQKLVISKFPKEITSTASVSTGFSLCAKASLSLRIFSRSIISRSCF
jgi:hypothetical protein